MANHLTYKNRPAFARLLDNSRIDSKSGCWIFTNVTGAGGYGVLKFNGKHVKAHRFSWYLFRNNKILNDRTIKILHKCDNPPCVNPDHLFEGTQLDNVRDMISKGRWKPPAPKHGEENHMSKLNKTLVLKMRKRYALGGVSYKKIGIQFKVSTMTAYRAITEQSWKEKQYEQVREHKRTSQSTSGGTKIHQRRSKR